MFMFVRFCWQQDQWENLRLTRVIPFLEDPMNNDSTFFEPLSKPREKPGPSQLHFKHNNVSDPLFPLNMTATTASHSVWPLSQCSFGTTCSAESQSAEECVILFECCLRHLFVCHILQSIQDWYVPILVSTILVFNPYKVPFPNAWFILT